MYYASDRLQAMRQMYESGHSLKAVGEAFYLCPQAVWSVFRKNGIPRRLRGGHNKGRCQKPERLKSMQAMHEAGMTFREIAGLYGVTPPAVSLLFKKHGIPRKRNR